MAPNKSFFSRAWGVLQLLFLRMAAGGWISPRYFTRDLPPPAQRQAREGKLTIEVVSHCWNYSHFLAYQLSSLVRFPPQKASVRMTVFYCPEDTKTAKLLAFFQQQQVENLVWNWQAFPKEQLFRRAIGRNQAALASQADWVWFTDCDLMFREGCFDTLAMQLQGRRDALVYPKEERCTRLLAEDNPMLKIDEPAVLDILTKEFTAQYPSRATGPLQITHGDVARALGYCNPLGYYQQPATHWCKAHEDRAHRWLLETPGIPLDVPGVYRIRHAYKGRYTRDTLLTRIRTGIRKNQSAKRERSITQH